MNMIIIVNAILQWWQLSITYYSHLFLCQVLHNDRMFECPYCRKQFKHRQARYRHSRFKCPENTDKCKKLWCRCGKGFLAKESLAKHKLKCDKREKKYMCHLCGKVYGTPSGLYIHKQTTHCDTVGGKYKHACEVCGKMFYRKQHYDRHIPKHSGMLVRVYVYVYFYMFVCFYCLLFVAFYVYSFICM